MINPPRTREEAEKMTYRSRYLGHEIGLIESQCAFAVWKFRGHTQCSRKPGHGPACLYCKQHAKKVRE